MRGVAGHSKWANRKHRKERQDAKKGKVFSKMAREIIIAARQGGGNPETNARLRLAVDKAKAMRVPMENIERAIQRGAGGGDEAALEELIYEGYGPGGVAVLLEIMTDNRNRTAGEIRHLFAKHGGNLGESGCVAWMFERKGLLSADAGENALDEDRAMEIALEAGAEDVKEEDGIFSIYTSPEDFEAVKRAVEARGVKLENAELTYVPKTEVRVEGKDAQQLLRLLDALEDHDDVQDVHANFLMDDAEMAEVGA